MTGRVLTVSIGDASGLVRQIAFGMNLNVKGMTVSAQATEGSSNYGVPVSVSAPPAGQVVPLRQLQDLVPGQAVSS